MSTIRIPEGFSGQHLFFVPRPILARSSSHPLLQSLLPTDVGWYPAARYHYFERDRGAPQHILIYCVKGEGWFELDGQMRSLNAGQALFIPQDMPHVYGSSEFAPWSIHWAHFVGIEADFYVKQVPSTLRTVDVDGECHARVHALFQQCYEVLTEGFVLNRLIHASRILNHLLCELLLNNAAFSSSQHSRHFRSIKPTLEYLRKHIDTSVTLAEMAEQTGLSVSHFSRTFKEQTGYSPMDYFLHMKVQKASSLLFLTDLTVREIAELVGYEDPYYFSRLYKKTVGMAPTVARKELYRRNPMREKG